MNPGSKSRPPGQGCPLLRAFRDGNGQPFAMKMLEMAKSGEGTIRYAFPRGTVNLTPQDKIAYVRGSAPWHLMIASAVYISEIDEVFWGMVQTASAVIVALMLLSIGIAWLVTRSVVKPLSNLKTRMATLSAGELEAQVADTDRPDEIGEMARTVQVFKDAMIETGRLRAGHLEAERQQSQQRKTDMNKLADAFESAVGQIIQTVSAASTELEASASSLSKSSEQAQTVTNKAAAASADASTNVRSVAAASEEMASSVNEISRQVQMSAKIAGDAVDQAQKTDVRMNQLSQAAGRIGAVVELINTIAGQTNLLALNATIEAARAGEAMPAEALPWLPPRSRRSPSRPPRPPAKSASKSPISSRRRRTRWWRSRRSAPRSGAFPKSPRPSPRRSKNRAPPPRRFPATCSGPRTALPKSPPTSPMCSAARPKPAWPPPRCFQRRSRCRRRRSRLKLEVGKFMGTVRAA